MIEEFCPICEEERAIKEVRCRESIEVRGEAFSVNAHYYRCTSCDEEFETSNSEYDPMAEAYRMYREKHSMLFPEQIKEFRHRYELTQKELTSLLGWGAVTLSRYENGALPSLSHDRELQEAGTQAGLMKLIELTPAALSERKRRRLNSILLLERGRRSDFLTRLDDDLSKVPPGETNGFRRFSLEKYLGAVEYLCSRGGVLITKLNKLLFYADFLHFKENQVSITGSQYAALPYGPVPNNYKKLLAVMEEDLSIVETLEVSYENSEYTGQMYIAGKQPHTESITEYELLTLERVAEYFDGMNSSEITKTSHEETGWKETERARLISYMHAETLSLTL